MSNIASSLGNGSDIDLTVSPDAVKNFQKGRIRRVLAVATMVTVGAGAVVHHQSTFQADFWGAMMNKSPVNGGTIYFTGCSFCSMLI